MKSAARMLARVLLATAPLPSFAVLPMARTAAALPANGGGPGLLQATAGMLLVLALIFACAWLARRFGMKGLGSSPLIKTVASAALGQRERVVIVEVGGTWLVLGVTPSQVTTLHSLAPQALAPSAQAPSDAGKLARMFSSKLQDALGRGQGQGG